MTGTDMEFEFASIRRSDLDVAIVGSRIHAVHKATMREWECSIESVTLDAITNGLESCAPESVESRIARAVADHKWIFECARDGTSIKFHFMIDRKCTDLIDFDSRDPDVIVAVLRRVESCGVASESEMECDTRTIVRLSAIIQQQRAEIAHLAQQVAASGELARRVCIVELFAQTTTQFGPIESEYFALAQRVFAAEVDGAPIVFRALGCDQPIWLRSVVRYVNMSEPFTTCVTDGMSAHDAVMRAPMRGIVLSKPIGGNTMSSESSMGLSDWILSRGSACRAQVLVIMALAYTWMGARRGIARLPAYANPLGIVRRKIMPGVTCSCPTVIFGYYGQTEGEGCCANRGDEYRGEAEKCCSVLRPWLAPCKSVRLAQFAWDRAAETTRVEDIAPDVSRDFALAIPATPENGVPISDKFIFNRGTMLSCAWDIPPFISRLFEERAPSSE